MEINDEYIMFFDNYPPYCMTYFIYMSKIIGINNAFEILKSIPKHYLTKTPNELYSLRNLIINYNYVWSMTLFKNDIDIDIIKNLLLEYRDYHYIEIIKINSIVKNSQISYEFMIDLYNESKNKKDVYYKLRMYKINHFHAYSISQLEPDKTDIILSVLKHVYDDNNSNYFINYTDEQIEFFKLARCAYSSIDDFINKIPIIIDSINYYELISINNFKLNEKGEFIV